MKRAPERCSGALFAAFGENFDWGIPEDPGPAGVKPGEKDEKFVLFCPLLKENRAGRILTRIGDFWYTSSCKQRNEDLIFGDRIPKKGILNEKRRSYIMKKYLRPRTFLIALAVLAVLITGFSSFTIVPAGHTGVVSRFGAVQETILPEGLHMKIPFVETVTTIDNRVNVVETSFTAASKDLQTVTGTVSVNYRISPDSSASVYRNFGLSVESTLMMPAVPECIKAVTARYSAEQLITMRQTVSDEIKEAIDEKIRPYGLYVEVFNITDFSFSEEFNAAIEAKQTAQQNALKAEQDLQRVKIEAEQKIEEARAEAESYRLKNQEITSMTLLNDWIEKWDGHLPTVVSGDDSTMMLDLSQLLEEAEKSGTATGSPAGE